MSFLLLPARFHQTMPQERHIRVASFRSIGFFRGNRLQGHSREDGARMGKARQEPPQDAVVH